MRVALPAALAVLAALSGRPAPASAAALDTYRQVFGNLSLGVAGGFQWWGLSGLEETLSRRSDLYALDGFALAGGDFDLTFAYSADLQLRLSDHWYLRGHAEWTRLEFEDRDRAFLQFLGSRERTPVSLAYSTQVRTNPLLFGVGAGRSWRGESLRWGLTASLLIAPVKVVEELEVFLESSFLSEVVATGTGVGGELALSIDWFTDTSMTLFLEAFWRDGSADVELERADWESTAIPGSRRVDLDGAGLRAGFRWL